MPWTSGASPTMSATLQPRVERGVGVLEDHLRAQLGLARLGARAGSGGRARARASCPRSAAGCRRPCGRAWTCRSRSRRPAPPPRPWRTERSTPSTAWTTSSLHRRAEALREPWRRSRAAGEAAGHAAQLDHRRARREFRAGRAAVSIAALMPPPRSSVVGVDAAGEAAGPVLRHRRRLGAARLGARAAGAEGAAGGQVEQGRRHARDLPQRLAAPVAARHAADQADGVGVAAARPAPRRRRPAPRRGRRTSPRCRRRGRRPRRGRG